MMPFFCLWSYIKDERMEKSHYMSQCHTAKEQGVFAYQNHNMRDQGDHRHVPKQLQTRKQAFNGDALFLQKSVQGSGAGLIAVAGNGGATP